MHKVILVGRVGKDAEMRYAPDGKAVASFSFAVDDGWGDNKKTVWFRCSLWGDRAEKLTQHITKGKGLYLEGRLQHDDGSPRIWGDPPKANFELSVSELTFLPGQPKGAQDTGDAWEG